MQDSNQNEFLNYRIKHANYTITNIEQALKFYNEAFGMRLLDRVDADDLRISLIFIGYGEYTYWEIFRNEGVLQFQGTCVNFVEHFFRPRLT